MYHACTLNIQFFIFIYNFHFGPLFDFIFSVFFFSFFLLRIYNDLKLCNKHTGKTSTKLDINQAILVQKKNKKNQAILEKKDGVNGN
jgi:hypothetical protein